MLNDARKAMHTMQLVVDALGRGKSDEALRYLEDVHQITDRIERNLRKPSEATQELPTAGKRAD